MVSLNTVGGQTLQCLSVCHSGLVRLFKKILAEGLCATFHIATFHPGKLQRKHFHQSKIQSSLYKIHNSLFIYNRCQSSPFPQRIFSCLRLSTYWKVSRYICCHCVRPLTVLNIGWILKSSLKTTCVVTENHLNGPDVTCFAQRGFGLCSLKIAQRRGRTSVRVNTSPYMKSCTVMIRVSLKGADFTPLLNPGQSEMRRI